MSSEIIFTNEATPSTPASGTTKTFVTSSKRMAQVDDTGLVLTLGAQSVVAGALVASPTGTTSTAGVMMGLANSSASNIITPVVTGRLLITICGVVAQNTTADGASWHIRTGTGAAPANAAALTGTQSGGQQSMTFLTGVLKVPFSLSTIVTGLTAGTAVWVDIVLAAVTGGTATMTQVMVTAVEL